MLQMSARIEFRATRLFQIAQALCSSCHVYWYTNFSVVQSDHLETLFQADHKRQEPLHEVVEINVSPPQLTSRSMIQMAHQDTHVIYDVRKVEKVKIMD